MPKFALAAPRGRIESILSPQDIAMIRVGYSKDPAWLANYSVASYDSMYPGGAHSFDSFNQALFTHGDPPQPPGTGIKGADRERSIISLLSTTFNQYFLAIHIYWGLAEGLSPTDLCQIMLVVGGYSGYEYYTNGLTVCLKTLTALKQQMEPGQPLSPQDALAAIQHAFPS